ncbi:MAG TPA: TRZ/ATZ family hydrolase [Spongiibacteraceae bacterium]|nr:TRZ/ATZ family hydrolase [Spongiibacteraceae bacterium]
MTETTVDLLIKARWLVPVQPAGQVLEYAALSVSKGCISGIHTWGESASIAALQVVELPRHALLPGLVNAHGHTPMTLFRGMTDDLPLAQWLADHIWPAEGRWVSEDFVRDGSTLAMAEMLLSGTTCFSDMYFFPDVTARVAEQLGMRAQIAFPVFETATAWGSGAEEYIHKGLVLHDQHKHSELLRVVFGPHAPYTVDDATLARVAVLAEELECGVHIHVHETAHEIADSLARHGMRPLQRLAELGLLSPRTQCVHGAVLTSDDIALLATHNSHVVHCPESNLKLASGFCPVQQLRDAGINVALGTDGAASNNDLDLFGELHTAALLAKAVAGDAAALPAAAALEMATLNGARAMGWDDRIGSLEIGKLADVIAVDLSGLAQQPLYDVISQLVYTQSGARVSHSWIQGRAVLSDGQLQTVDTRELRQRVVQWRDRIHSSL